MLTGVAWLSLWSALPLPLLPALSPFSPLRLLTQLQPLLDTVVLDAVSIHTSGGVISAGGVLPAIYNSI